MPRKISPSRFRSIALSTFVALCFPMSAIADGTFRAQVKMRLCPEYALGGVTVSVKYFLDGNPEPIDPTIVSSNINSSDNTATFVIDFPNTYGTQRFNVKGFCTASQGESNPSNTLKVSNCDAIALEDDDADGLLDNLEDTNCDNFFSPGDKSNRHNRDSDGDGVTDVVEFLDKTDATNPGVSSRPYVLAGAPFDPDNDGNSNPVAWRPTSGTWFIQDFPGTGLSTSFPLGQAGDIPFAYNPRGFSSDFGVIRLIANQYHWFFHGVGFVKSDLSPTAEIVFGSFGDNIVLGPWEEAGVTSPAVATLFNGFWSFSVYLRDGTVRSNYWGQEGDIPRPGDYDGDGIFDRAVFRPSDGKTYVVKSSNNTSAVYSYFPLASDTLSRGDVTGDNIDDIIFWEPTTGRFSAARSEANFSPASPIEESLGLYGVHLPLPWNQIGSKTLFSVVNHLSGERFYKPNNSNAATPVSVQWGIVGDSML